MKKIKKNSLKQLLNEASKIKPLVDLIEGTFDNEGNPLTIKKERSNSSKDIISIDINDELDTSLVSAVKELINAQNISNEEFIKMINPTNIKKGSEKSYNLIYGLRKSICSLRRANELANILNYELEINFENNHTKEENKIVTKSSTTKERNNYTLDEVINLRIDDTDERNLKKLKKVLNSENIKRKDFYEIVGRKAAYDMLYRISKGQYDWAAIETIAMICNKTPKIIFKKK